MEGKTIDLDELYRTVREKLETSPDSDEFWTHASLGVLQGVIGAAENVGAGTADDLFDMLGAAARDEDGANALAVLVEDWAGGLEERDLAESSEWREAYSDAIKSTSPKTFLECVAIVRAAIDAAL